MHFPFFNGNVQDVLVGILNVKMFGSGTKKWFVKNNKRQRTKGRKPVNRKRKKWVAKVLKQHREMILKELDVNKVMPHLVYDKVFSLGEYKEILGQDSSKKRAELFLDQLSQKGPSAFNAFCSVLEEVCPHLLTCFLLDCEGKSDFQKLVSCLFRSKVGKPHATGPISLQTKLTNQLPKCIKLKGYIGKHLILLAIYCIFIFLYFSLFSMVSP